MKKIVFFISLLMSISVFLVQVQADSSPRYEFVDYEELAITSIMNHGDYYFVKIEHQEDYDRIFSHEGEEILDTGYFISEKYLDEGLNYGNISISEKVREIMNFSEVVEGNFNLLGGYIFTPTNDNFKFTYLNHIIELYALEQGNLISDPGRHLLNYDSHTSIEQIKSRYTAYDNYDGNITANIEFKTNYPSDYSEVKINTEYYIEASVSDSAGHTSKVRNTIEVFDITAPVFRVENNNIQIEYQDNLSLDDVKLYIQCEDNYDGQISSSKIQLKEHCEFDPRSLTTQTLEFYYIDSSGNESSCTVNVLLVDNEAPVINVGEIVEVNPDDPLTKEEVIRILTSSNTIPANVKNVDVISDYFGNENVAGEYIATCIVTLENDSVEYYEFIINVPTLDVADSSPKSNTSLIIGLICGSIGLLVLGSVGYLFIKRRRTI